jgi:hypothetical protein
LEIGIGFLYESYRPGFWYGEIIEVLRKMMLTSLVTLMGSNSFTHLTVATTLSVLALAIHIQAKPFPKDELAEYWQQFVALSAIIVTLIVGSNLRAQQAEQELSASPTTPDNDGLGVLLLLTFILSMLVPFIPLVMDRSTRKDQVKLKLLASDSSTPASQTVLNFAEEEEEDLEFRESLYNCPLFRETSVDDTKCHKGPSN